MAYAAWLPLSFNLNVDDKIPLKFNNYISAWESLQTSLLNTFLLKQFKEYVNIIPCPSSFRQKSMSLKDR